MTIDTDLLDLADKTENVEGDRLPETKETAASTDPHHDPAHHSGDPGQDSTTDTDQAKVENWDLNWDDDQAPTLDLDQVRRFIDEAYPRGMVDGQLRVASTGNWAGRGFDRDLLDDLLAYVAQLDRQGKAGIYLRTTTVRADVEPGKRGKAEDSVEMIGLYLDLDIADPSHKHDPAKTNGLTLPPDEDTARRIVADAGLPDPTLWVHSGGGMYPYWLLSVPEDVTDEDDRREAARINADLHDLVQLAAKAAGYHYGTGTKDLARVLRIPGTVNRKPERTSPAPCRIIEETGARFTLDEMAKIIEENLTRLRPPKPASSSTPPPAKDGAGLFDFAGKPADEDLDDDQPPSVLDDFEARVNWAEILEPHGWTFSHQDDKAGTRYWTRPGKENDEGHSASTGHEPDRDRMFNWSDAAGLPVQEPMTKPYVWAILNGHGNPPDMTAAAAQLKAEGYGPQESDDDDQDQDDDSWTPVDLTAVLSGNYTPPRASIGRRSDGVALLYPGREHVIASEPEAGKTWLLCQITVDELAAGGRVLYVDFEDDEAGIVGRMLELGADPDQLRDLDRFRYVRPAEQIATSEAAATKKYGRLTDFGHEDDQDLGPTLVVLDGLTEGYGLHGWDINDNNDSPKWRRAFIKPAIRTGAATVASDHVVKNPDARRGFAIGAQHKKAGITGALFGLQNVTPLGRGILGRSELVIYKDRPGGLRQYGVRRDDGYVHLADLILDGRAADLVQVQDDGTTNRAGVELEIRAPEQAADGAKDAAASKLQETVERIEEILTKRGPMTQRDLRAAVRGRGSQVDEAVQYMITAELLHEGKQVRGQARLRHLSQQCREGFRYFTDPFTP